MVYDDDGKPQTVRYHFVNAMLLNEVQKQRRMIETQRQSIEELASRLGRLETTLLGSNDGDRATVSAAPRDRGDRIEK